MFLKNITPGRNAPDEINVIIENPMGGTPVKYELDKESGMMFVDRILHTAMYYPGNYGFIPHTLSGDGDPMDVLVIGRTPVMPGAVMRCRAVGVLMMEDNAGQDEKIIAVPVPELHPYHNNVENYTDLRPILLDQIVHFFSHYKDLEPGKWARTDGWKDAAAARQMIVEGIARAQAKA
ncbi:MAG: inorganic diphosphatase [Alphaproteobacteria bacterium]|nr:inorganic diphosphatase [Alphaproteobacteria bacterium]